MLGFMDYVQNAFYEASRWNRDNSYGSLTDTARALLDFSTPHGLRLNVSSLSSPNFATSYTLGSIGLVDGSLSYLYTSLPLKDTLSKSRLIPLQHLIPGYRQLQNLRQPDELWWWEIWEQGKRIDRRDALLYGRLYLPHPTLEALYLRRITPRTQLKFSCVSDSRLPNGGSILALVQHDTARHSSEYIYSTDSALLGIRGLYNFGPDPDPAFEPPLPALLPPISDLSATTATAPATPVSPATLRPIPIPASISKQPPHGRFSAGFELYYSPLNKSSGTSAGVRFATLPAHQGFPYTMTLTLNPLMGNLSSTYSVRASRWLALSSRLDFNFYSYESSLRLGGELWRLRKPPGVVVAGGESTKTSEDEGKVSQTSSNDDDEKNIAGVLKARVDRNGEMALLWEGRIKELVYGCGVTVDFRRGEDMVRGLGVEVCYSS